MTATSRNRTVLLAVTTVLAIVCGALLWHRLPVSTDVYAPFDVRGTIGERTAGRGLSAVVDGVTIAPVLRPSESEKTQKAVGIWVVVDGSFDADPDYGLMHVELLVGPNHYNAAALLYQPPQLQPGITEQRGWPFDVAPDVLDKVDSVVFRAWLGDGRLDTRLVIDIPLDDQRVRHTAVVEIPPPHRVGR